MTSWVANVWQGCVMYLAWEVGGLIAGTAAGIKAAVAAFLLSEILRELIEYRGSRR
jgi:hypothetical protein